MTRQFLVRLDRHDGNTKSLSTPRSRASVANADAGAPCPRTANPLGGPICLLRDTKRRARSTAPCHRTRPIDHLARRQQRAHQSSNRHRLVPHPALVLSSAVSSLGAYPTPALKPLSVQASVRPKGRCRTTLHHCCPSPAWEADDQNKAARWCSPIIRRSTRARWSRPEPARLRLHAGGRDARCAESPACIASTSRPPAIARSAAHMQRSSLPAECSRPQARFVEPTRRMPP